MPRSTIWALMTRPKALIQPHLTQAVHRSVVAGRGNDRGFDVIFLQKGQKLPDAGFDLDAPLFDQRVHQSIVVGPDLIDRDILANGCGTRRRCPRD